MKEPRINPKRKDIKISFRDFIKIILPDLKRKREDLEQRKIPNEKELNKRLTPHKSK